MRNLQLSTAVLVLVVVGCSKPSTPISPTEVSISNPTAAQPPVDPVVPAAPASPGPVQSVMVIAGDIDGCKEGGERTAVLAASILASQPDSFAATTGDNVYPYATEYYYRRCYGQTWGLFLASTYPSPGNHDLDEGAESGAYENYFRRPLFYSYQKGGWQIYSINSVAGSAQAGLIRSGGSQPQCSAAYFHHPMFTSGQNGPNPQMMGVWQAMYEAGVDVVINSHDHLYERFAPQDPYGRPDMERGIRQFTVGTGGGSLYQFTTSASNSEARIAGVHGVLKLSLRTNAYDWEFVSVGGIVMDSGTAMCR